MEEKELIVHLIRIGSVDRRERRRDSKYVEMSFFATTGPSRRLLL